MATKNQLTGVMLYTVYMYVGVIIMDFDVATCSTLIIAKKCRLQCKGWLCIVYGKAKDVESGSKNGFVHSGYNLALC